MANKTIWYLPLEDVKSRYTNQLCNFWIPDALQYFKKNDTQIKTIIGKTVISDIKVGHVLDATGRGIFSLTQMANFLEEINKGNVKEGDSVYIQDYWTPGLEAVQYAFDLYKLKDIKVYSMLHAQSVDEYDFTYSMRDWMRPVELAYDKIHMNGGIFVGSTIHKTQLRNAGFKAPIHVVSLPFGYAEVYNRMSQFPRNVENAVVFCSRMDTEKNPMFMMDLAEKFLEEHKDWKFYITTSGKTIRGNVQEVIDRAYNLAKKNNRFIILENLSKDQYYETLCKSKIQLNTSLQDYVSWTLLEAAVADCDICYPNFRSFPEILPKDRMYNTWSLDSAMKVLNNCIKNPRTHQNIAQLSNMGRLMEGYIINNGINKEVNIWINPKEFHKVLRGD